MLLSAVVDKPQDTQFPPQGAHYHADAFKTVTFTLRFTHELREPSNHTINLNYYLR